MFAVVAVVYFVLSHDSAGATMIAALCDRDEPRRLRAGGRLPARLNATAAGDADAT